jgi:Na+-transporting NADH:ubiquinone oxidoreductase subunit B
MGLRRILDDIAPHFEKGGRYEKWFALYEAVDTIFYSPSKVTVSPAHVRDGVDLKRIMITVWLAAFPAMFYGMYNVGFQATSAMADMGLTTTGDWHAYWIELFSSYNPNSIWDNFWFGAVHYLHRRRVLGSALRDHSQARNQ